jgi:hypothetical protein
VSDVPARTRSSACGSTRSRRPANFLLLHLGRPKRAAAEFARVLAPGGRVALTDETGGHLALPVSVKLASARKA